MGRTKGIFDQFMMDTLIIPLNHIFLERFYFRQIQNLYIRALVGTILKTTLYQGPKGWQPQPIAGALDNVGFDVMNQLDIYYIF